jgi:spermidine synthase
MPDDQQTEPLRQAEAPAAFADGWHELARATTGSGDVLVLRERAGTVELRCNGWDLMSNRAHYSEEALAALGCAQLTATAPRVLIGGLGFGYTVRAALDRLPCVARIVLAELLPELIAWNRGPLARFAGHPLADRRVAVICADIAAVLRDADPASFDAILLDTDNGPEAVTLPGNATLYGPDGLRAVRRALRPGGVLAVWSADRSPCFERSLHDAGFRWCARDVPARGAPGDPLHTIYLAMG